VHYVDITPISKQARDNKDLSEFDGLHLSAVMYQQWVEEMLPTVKSIIEKK